MDWKTEIKLTYRIFVRQHRNVEDQFRDAVASVYGVCTDPNVEVKVAGPTDLLIPLRQIDVAKAEAEGKLAVEKGGTMFLLVYQWQVTVDVSQSENHAMYWVDEILQSTGQVWTNIQILKECVTDVVPI